MTDITDSIRHLHTVRDGQVPEHVETYLRSVIRYEPDPDDDALTDASAWIGIVALAVAFALSALILVLALYGAVRFANR